MSQQPSKDVTQRVRLDEAGQTVHKSATSHPANPRRNQNKKHWRMTRKEKITLIALGSVTAILLITAIIMVSSMFTAPADDGRILKGVVAAGVNLGGMTQDEAAVALENATANTYSKLDMVVTVLDSQITLSPKDTGANLDIQSVVNDAYNYGRTGSRAERAQAKNNALEHSVIIPITSYLNLNTDFIRSEINKLGSQFSSTLSQPSITLTGEKPSMDVSNPNTSTVHQTLFIYVGTAEYGLDTNKLYEQVLEYYNINIFQVVGVCTVVAPDSIEDELFSYYEQLCVEPVDAQIDPITYEVTPEVYGYGFDLDAVKEQITQAAYGTTLEIPLRYLAPNLTEELLSSNLFKDVMGDFSSSLGAETAWNNNATLACQKLNGLILKSGDTFSFNDLLGELTAAKGYQEALAYRGIRATMVMGGGVTHTASVLYNSVLEAELEILEHHSHTYAVNFIEIGRDAYVDGDTADFRFRNNRSDPIRIKAEVVGGEIQISIEGTDTRDYTVTISISKELIRPGKLSNIMLFDNPGGYINGQVLVSGINGYDVEVRNTQYSKTTGLPITETVVDTIRYEARDSVVVKLQGQSSTPDTVPPESTPSSTGPNDATVPDSSATTSPATSGPSGTNVSGTSTT